MWSGKKTYDEKIRSPQIYEDMTSQVHWMWCTYLHFWGIPQATTSNWLDPIEWPGRRPSRDAKQTLKSDAPKRAVGMSQKQTPNNNPNEIKVVVIFCNWKKIDSEIPLILKCFFLLSIRNCFAIPMEATGRVWYIYLLIYQSFWGLEPNQGIPNPTCEIACSARHTVQTRAVFGRKSLDKRSVDVLFWLVGEVFEDLEIVRRVWK